MQATPVFSDQTKADLTSILETLDQRIHEVNSSNTSGEPVSDHERAALGTLRDAAVRVLGDCH